MDMAHEHAKSKSEQTRDVAQLVGKLALLAEALAHLIKAVAGL
jgi:hypothetical protein